MIGPLGSRARRLLAPLALLTVAACDGATRPEDVLEADVRLARADVPLGDPLVFTVVVRNPSGRTVPLPLACGGLALGAQVSYALWPLGTARPQPSVVCPEPHLSYRDPEQAGPGELAAGDSLVRTFHVIPTRTVRVGIMSYTEWWDPGTYLVAGGLVARDHRLRPASAVDTLRIVAP